MLLRSHVGRDSGNYVEKQLFSAKNYVYICSPIISPAYVKRLIVLLVDGGVKARIITSNDDTKDKYGDRTPKLLKNAVKQDRRLLGKSKNSTKPPLEFKLIKKDRINANLYIMDGMSAMAGSVNLTEDSMWNNLEYLLIGENAKEVGIMEHDFENLWSQYEGKEIVDEHLLEGGLWNKIKGGFDL